MDVMHPVEQNTSFDWLNFLHIYKVNLSMTTPSRVPKSKLSLYPQRTKDSDLSSAMSSI